MSSLQLLETTLRDGSYAINFQFTARDTALIASALEGAGVTLIDIGHGIGLHASDSGKGQAAETDRAYMEAAAGVLTKAKFGVFCIPGIATLDDVDMAAQCGAGFIRIGTNVTEVEASQKFIEKAKRFGMLVTANLMKSYALEPKQFAEKAKLMQQFGSDVLYIVDSSGGMLPGELEAYFRMVRDACEIPLGFHGHNNLGMAVANTLRAVELGAVIIDTSLQGMGRSAGNASTEIVVASLNRMGIDLGIDPLTVLDIGEKYVRPLIRRRGISSLDVIAGYAQFHTSYMGVIRKYSSKYSIDPRKLIVELCAVDKVDAREELVDSIACRLKTECDEVFTARYEFDEYFGDEQRGQQ